MNSRRAFVLAIAGSLGALALFCAPRLGGAAPAASLHGFGIVYLHGKGAWPGGLDGGILSSLKDEGALVATPEMPWSFHRRYDATYDQAMAEIGAAEILLSTSVAPTGTRVMRMRASFMTPPVCATRARMISTARAS